MKFPSTAVAYLRHPKRYRACLDLFVTVISAALLTTLTRGCSEATVHESLSSPT
ncbi:hypothetical protein PanWU01x14_217040, partial [Parasponia andersonii]